MMAPSLNKCHFLPAARCAARREINTPIGRFWLAASINGLMNLACEPRPALDDAVSQTEIDAANAHLDEVCHQLYGFLASERQSFTVALAPKGTDFQRAVWQQLVSIPFGVTQSYSQIATAISRPKAVRAVGAANGANPIAIIVPCHRVIGKNGSLTGYAWGLEMKSALLALESPITTR